ncbi:transglycosylase SLT domain-containing protein [Streptococcus gallolyticus]|jgi:chitodextrinase|uniref:Lytic transglycosylase domain-containing protein n=1 Tax=Streptococcus gallolyticus TaxID=315405 RepID=A0A927XG48_9STRE|nr:transglycosylase SLT domain-containing protein [Streptococcus gallolyticus]MBE6165160.1 lytic transglycosylase domain-containing protein [Streptococcus gallolyticus]MCY7188006.1 transglycosylase SLT domain-containing protein [Streptococcus gallolyticus subsp. gallolyticus]
MYSRIAKAKQRKIRNIIVSVLGATLSLAMITFLIPKIELFSDTFTTHAEAEVVKSTSTSLSSTLNQTVTSTTSSESSSAEVSEVSEEPATEEATEVEEVYTESEEPVVEDTTATESASYTTTSSEVVDETTASNGNTAGTVGTEAAAQMAAATGVPQSTWEAIIARESNGDPSVTNASGASGLFQTMPGWGSTATVQDQITAAINAYNAQGLSAWGY